VRVSPTCVYTSQWRLRTRRIRASLDGIVPENHKKSKILDNSVWNWNRSNRTARKDESGGMPVSGSRSGSEQTLGLRIHIRYKKYEKSQLKNKYWKKIKTIRSKKSGHVSGYVSRERGATIYPTKKKFVLEISINREKSMEEIAVNDDNMIKWKR